MEPETSIQQGRRKRKISKRSKRYDAGFKLQVVKKFIEEGVPVRVIVQECGVSHETVRDWALAYRQHGAKPGPMKATQIMSGFRSGMALADTYFFLYLSVPNFANIRQYS